MWTVKADTAPGPYHVRSNVENQDAYGWRQEQSTLAIVAADGAGSLDLSHLGSRLAVDTILDEFFEAEGTLGERLDHAVVAARQALLAHPDADRIGCTVAVLVADGSTWLAGLVGDAFVVVQHEDGRLQAITTPPTAYANQTTFLTSDELEYSTTEGEGALLSAAAATDGLELVGLKNGEAFKPFWDSMFTYCGMEGFEVGAVFERMSEDGRMEDDCTLVLAVRSTDE